jgi:putative acetyltransferase
MTASHETRMALDPQHFRIRAVEPGDYAGFHASMGSPNAVAGTLQLPFTSDEHWRKLLETPRPESAVLVAEVRDPAAPDAPFEIVANAGLHPTGPSLRRRHVMGLGIAVRDDWQGRGIGTALVAALIDRADNWMNVLRIELTVYIDNESARSLYERFGFVVEGVHRAYALRAGAYVDAYAMARLHPNPPMLQTPIKE